MRLVLVLTRATHLPLTRRAGTRESAQVKELTTLRSYGTVSTARQAEIITGLSESSEVDNESLLAEIIERAQKLKTRSAVS